MTGCHSRWAVVVALTTGLICLTFDVPAESKGVVQSTLTVTVRNDFDRTLTGATLTLTGDSTSLTLTASVDGAYSFPAQQAGSYTLETSDPFFLPDTRTVELSGAVEGETVVLSLDDMLFPNEILDQYREFDTDLSGALSEAEFTATFADGRDAYVTYLDRCECTLTPRNIAALFNRPFLSVGPTKSLGDGPFPTNTVDFGVVAQGLSHTRTLTLTNEGGGTLSGTVTFEAHAGTSLSPSPPSYMLTRGKSVPISLVVPAQDPGPLSGLLLLGGNYDGEPVPIGITGEIVAGEGEGEGEGEPPGCALLDESDVQAASGAPFIFGMTVMLLLLSRGARRPRE